MKKYLFLSLLLGVSQIFAQPAGKFGGGDAAGYARAQFGSGLALVVELNDFSAIAESEGVRLQWRTDREWQNSHFEVEHRVEGRPFATIGWIAGAGNRQEESYYDFVDYAPQEGRNYYRIKDVDWNGNSHFSEVREVFFASKDEFRVYPISGSDDFQLFLPQDVQQQDFLIQVFSLGGQEVWRGQFPASFSGGRSSLGLSGCPRGLYVVRLLTRHGDMALPCLYVMSHAH